MAGRPWYRDLDYFRQVPVSDGPGWEVSEERCVHPLGGAVCADLVSLGSRPPGSGCSLSGGRKKVQSVEVCLLIDLLSRIAPPNHARDYRDVVIIAQGMKGLLLLPAGALIAGVYGLTSWDLKPGRVLVEIAAGAIVVGLLHMGLAVRRLQRGMALRALCRSKRLALPPPLAEGIAAAELMNVPKVVETIYFRTRRKEELSDMSVQVFDCLIADMYVVNPCLYKELRQWALDAQKKA